MYRQADSIVTVTEGFKENISQRGINSEKIHTIPNGADLGIFQPGEKPTSLAEELDLVDKFVVLYLGAHGISHGLETILDAAAELADLDEIVFLLVGDGSKKAELQEKAQAENLENLIFFPPISKDLVPSYYNLADLCLVPLRDVELFKTFIPSKMFEIMAMGKPIVASLSGEAAAIMESSGGALVTEPENTGEIVNAIRVLYHDPQKRLDLGKNGREFVEARYSREMLAEKYISVMRGSKK